MDQDFLDDLEDLEAITICELRPITASKHNEDDPVYLHVQGKRMNLAALINLELNKITDPVVYQLAEWCYLAALEGRLTPIP